MLSFCTERTLIYVLLRSFFTHLRGFSQLLSVYPALDLYQREYRPRCERTFPETGPHGPHSTHGSGSTKHNIRAQTRKKVTSCADLRCFTLLLCSFYTLLHKPRGGSPYKDINPQNRKNRTIRRKIIYTVGFPIRPDNIPPGPWSGPMGDKPQKVSQTRAGTTLIYAHLRSFTRFFYALFSTPAVGPQSIVAKRVYLSH